MILTEIDAIDEEADVYFPKFDENEWKKNIISEHEFNNIKYKHILYKRK